MNAVESFKGFLEKFHGFLENSKRIFAVSKKPTGKEYWTMAKVVGIGIIVISVIGFLVFTVFTITKWGGVA